MIALVETVFEKVRDPTTGAFYYFDKRSGESSWSKPALLGNKDLPETFYVRDPSEP